MVALTRGFSLLGESSNRHCTIIAKPKYMPDNQKLARRIIGKFSMGGRLLSEPDQMCPYCRSTEIELALEGEVPVPKRSGGPLLQDPQSATSAKEDASRATTLCQSEYNRVDDNRSDSVQGNKRYSEESRSDTTGKQLPLKRSKALSRPLADVTKMVNLASLAEDEDVSAKLEQSKVGVLPKSRQIPKEAYYEQAPARKLQVYRDHDTTRASATHHLEVSSAFESAFH